MSASSNERQSQEAIIVIRDSGLGDMIVALPILNAIRFQFPNHQILLLTNSKPFNVTSPLPIDILGSRESPFYDRLFFFDSNQMSVSSLLKLKSSLSSYKIDRLFFIQHPSFFLLAQIKKFLFFKFCGARQMHGFSLNPQHFKWRKVNADLFEREVFRLVRMVSPPLSVDLTRKELWDLHLTSDERRRGVLALGDVYGQPYIVCHIGGSKPSKIWPMSRWADLISKLRRAYPTLSIVVIGGSHDAHNAQEIIRSTDCPILTLVSDLDIRVVASIIEGAVHFIGHDSGPAHIAGAQLKSITSIAYNNGIPGVWYPWGEKAHVIFPKTSIEEITVDDVFRSAYERIGSALAIGPTQ